MECGCIGITHGNPAAFSHKIGVPGQCAGDAASEVFQGGNRIFECYGCPFNIGGVDGEKGGCVADRGGADGDGGWVHGLTPFRWEYSWILPHSST